MGLELGLNHEMRENKEPQVKQNPWKTEDFRNYFERVKKLHDKYHMMKAAMKPPGKEDAALSLTSPDYVNVIEGLGESEFMSSGV